MKKSILATLSLFVILLFAEETAIAVNDLTGNGITETELSILSDRLRSELTQTDSYAVMERGEMNAILMEMEFQKSGACDEASCMVEVGQILGVEKIVAGSVGRLGNFYTVSLRLIDVATGRVEKTANLDYSGEISSLISSGLGVVARKLAGDETTVNQPIIAKTTTPKNLKPVAVKWSKLTIGSTPAGASLSINDSAVGATPFTNELVPGRYTIALSLAGYKDFSKRITLTDGVTLNKEYELDPLREKKRGRLTRIISGSLSAVTLASGLYMDGQVKKYSDEAQQVYDDAIDAGDGVDSNQHYLEAKANAESSTTTRNIFYALSGVSITVFAVSFAF